MRDDQKRQHVKQLVREAAFDTGQECPTCHGTGQVPGGRKVIHCFAGSSGADWDVATVLALIDTADEVGWVSGLAGHDLAVRADGKLLSIQVSRPPQDGGAA